MEGPAVTVVGDRHHTYVEELIVDERTGQLLVVYGPSLDALEQMVNEAMIEVTLGDLVLY